MASQDCLVVGFLYLRFFLCKDKSFAGASEPNIKQKPRKLILSPGQETHRDVLQQRHQPPQPFSRFSSIFKTKDCCLQVIPSCLFTLSKNLSSCPEKRFPSLLGSQAGSSGLSSGLQLQARREQSEAN